MTGISGWIYEKKHKDLTEDELYAIYRYITSDSYILNEKLRKGMSLSEEEDKWEKNLFRALSKIPKYRGIVYRSLSSQMIRDIHGFNKKYSVGKVVVEEAYTSASIDIYDDTMDVQFIIKSKMGADIRRYNPSESEILFAARSEFFVEKREGNKIWLKEI